MNYDSAIDDYGKAIGLKLASQVFLMSLPQIRTLYPELNRIQDHDLLEGLRQKYFPNMGSSDFANNYKHDTLDKKQRQKAIQRVCSRRLYTSRGDT